MAGLGALVVIGIVLYLGFLGQSWTAVGLVAAVGLAFFLFFAPSDCRALIRGGRVCRNNAKGFLGGCHLQQHKRQTMSRYLRAGPVGQGWGARYWDELLGTPRQVVSTVGTATSLLTLGIALIGGLIG